MIYALIILLVFCLYLAYMMCKKDIMAAPVLVVLMFIMSALCALANKKNWGLELSADTVFLIVLGIISFTVGFVVIRNSRTSKRCHAEISPVPDIEKYKSILVIIYGFVTILLFLAEVHRIASDYGYSGGFSTMMSAYSAVTKYKTTLGAGIRGMSTFVNLMYKGLTALAYVYVYLFLNSAVIKKKIDYILLVPIAQFVICTICSASRLGILKLLVSGTMMFFGFMCAKNEWKKVRLKEYRRIIIIVAAVAFLFSYSRGLVGRNNTSDAFTYITTYAGGSIALLDSYLENPTSSNTLVGQESFSAIYSIIYRLTGDDKYNYALQKEFRTSATGITIGNVYTAFRAYYNDFGYWGCVFIPFAMGMLYAGLYKRMIYSKDKSKINMDVMIYGYLSVGFIFMSIDDLFCSTIIGANTIIMLIMFYMIRWFFLKVRIRLR